MALFKNTPTANPTQWLLVGSIFCFKWGRQLRTIGRCG